RVSQGWGHNFLPTTLPEPANQAPLIYLYPRQVLGSETHTFTPNLVNEFRLAQVYTRNNQDISGPRLFEQFGIKGALDTPRIKGLPQFTVTGFTSLGPAGPGATPIAASGSGNAPSEKSGKIWQFVDSLSWVHGRHTFKFGGEIHRITEFVYATNSARPNFTFNGTYSGNALADFMLGYIYNTGTSQQQVDTIQPRLFHLYVRDAPKICPALTFI